MTSVVAGVLAQAPATGTRWTGLRPGSYSAGFEVKRGFDVTRADARYPDGVPMGLALWYPSAGAPGSSSPLSSLDYRESQFFAARPADTRRAYEDDQAQQMVASPHVGIVALTHEQAVQALRSTGQGFAGLPPVAGRRSVVLVLGGPYYQATTAELLASHGFLVAAPFRFLDRPLERGGEDNAWYPENAVRDAEWALHELQDDARADMRTVIALGHGGGGAQALLAAMHRPDITAIVNLDAGNFSTRTNLRRLSAYDPARVRVPYLYIATRATRDAQDRFDEFAAMHASDRYEVVLEGGVTQHHDLSDLGRSVTAPLSLRGQDQAHVAAQFAVSLEVIARFANAAAARDTTPFGAWLQGLNAPGRYLVRISPAD